MSKTIKRSSPSSQKSRRSRSANVVKGKKYVVTIFGADGKTKLFEKFTKYLGTKEGMNCFKIDRKGGSTNKFLKYSLMNGVSGLPSTIENVNLSDIYRTSNTNTVKDKDFHYTSVANFNSNFDNDFVKKYGLEGKTSMQKYEKFVNESRQPAWGRLNITIESATGFVGNYIGISTAGNANPSEGHLYLDNFKNVLIQKCDKEKCSKGNWETIVDGRG